MELMHRDRLAWLHGRAREPGPVREEGRTDWVSGVRTATVTHGQIVKRFRVRLYTATELTRTLAEVGFGDIQAAGGLEWTTEVSPETRLAVRATRPSVGGPTVPD